MFGRRKQKEQVPPLPELDWRKVWRFTIGTYERRSTVKGAKSVHGARAVRVPRREGEGWIFPPCAYFPTKRFQDLGTEVYKDVELQQLLCALDEPFERNGEEVYCVRDARSKSIGSIRRIPSANRLSRHTWRIDQPGRPTVIGRNKWAKKSPKEMAGVALESTFDFLARSSGDGSYSRDRELEWKTADGELVMKSCGYGGYEMRLEVEIEARWLDRRLAFAYAMLRDSPAI